MQRRLAKAGPDDEAAAPPQWAGLKFFNVYGPNEYHKGGQASVAWHLFGQLSRGEPAKLFQSHHPDYADGGQLRDFIWVGRSMAAKTARARSAKERALPVPTLNRPLTFGLSSSQSMTSTQSPTQMKSRSWPPSA